MLCEIDACGRGSIAQTLQSPVSCTRASQFDLRGHLDEDGLVVVLVAKADGSICRAKLEGPVPNFVEPPDPHQAGYGQDPPSDTPIAAALTGVRPVLYDRPGRKQQGMGDT